MTPRFIALPALVALALAGCATPPAPPSLQDTTAPPVAAVAEPLPAAASAPSPAVEVVPPTPAPEPAVVAAIDPLRPGVRIDLDDTSVHTDLWERTRRGFAMPELEGELVRKWEQFYLGKPDYLQRMFQRGGRYLFHIVDEISRRNLPTELALLPFVESAFNPQAMSTAQASGMWQFIPGTGRDFDLKQNVFRDDRRDVLASTRAALDYLTSLHAMFGDWQLALAAYNWGQGSVQRAVERNARAGLPTGYEQLRMPSETRNYLPKLQAIKNLVGRPEAFGLSLPALENHPYFLAVPIEHDIDVDLAARLAGLSVDEFRQLNPQMNKPVILAAGTPQVLLPYDAANVFVRALARHKGMMASWTAWVAPRTMPTAEVARVVGMSEAQLREVNRIPPRMLVKTGSTLLVPRSGARSQDVAEHIADTAVLALAPEPAALRKLSFKAGKKGTTVQAVARQYRTSPVQVAIWNGVTAQSTFKPGQTVVVMVPARASVARGTGQRTVKVAASGSGSRKQ